MSLKITKMKNFVKLMNMKSGPNSKFRQIDISKKNPFRYSVARMIDLE